MKDWFRVDGDWQKPASKGREFAVLRCPVDGFGKVFPTPDAEELASYYDIENYYTRGVATRRDDGGSVTRALVEKAAARLNRKEPGRNGFIDGLSAGRPLDILDIGCGSGRLMRRAAAQGHRVVGIEPDAASASRAADFPLEVHDGTAETIPAALAGRTFDAITAIHVLEHTVDPAKSFENIAALLKPEGRAYIETPNCASLDFLLSRLSWPHLEIPRHLNLWTAALLSEMGRRHGLEATRIWHVGYVRQFGASWARNGARIAGFHSDAPGRLRLRGFVGPYAAALFLLTLAAPRHRRYDTCGIVFAKGA